MPAETAAPRFSGHYPYRAPIDAYGNGGFRFAEMSHRGSLLCMPDGMFSWDARTAADVTDAALAPILAKLVLPHFLLLGTGRIQVFPDPAIRRAFAARAIGLECMDTGAAARTYNVLLAEKRPVCAALLAVD